MALTISSPPWGEVRSWWTSALTTTPAYELADYTFTGQYSYMDDLSTPVTEGFGLMFYNARMYDPALGRFTSADSIVPGGVQGLDRYAYVNNDPIRYTDPSGHFTKDEIAEMWGFKNKDDNSFLNLWQKWLDNGFSDVLLHASWGDIITFKYDTGQTLNLMFGQMKDGTLGFWNVDEKKYYDRGFADWSSENANSWALFTRDTSGDSQSDHDFDNYTSTPWKKGDAIDIPLLLPGWYRGEQGSVEQEIIRDPLTVALGLGEMGLGLISGGLGIASAPACVAIIPCAETIALFGGAGYGLIDGYDRAFKDSIIDTTVILP